MMILEPCRWVAGRSRHVRIDEPRLHELCAGLDPARLRLPDWQIPVVPAWRDERLVDYVHLFNSVNFCYWTVGTRSKWTVELNGEAYDGAYGMMAALTRALVQDGYPLLDGAFLAQLTPDAFYHILRGNVPIPLLAERLAIWHEVGAALVAGFDGRWHRVVERAAGSAVELVHLLVAHMPSWDDVAEYDGRRIPFYKRAQLAVGMVYQAFGGQGWGAFHDFAELTVYADYKLPQVLRRLGILVYDEALAAALDGQALIAAGSPMEVEIRAATVWAAEQIRRSLLPRAPGLTAAHIDFLLWEAGQAKSPADRPYHRTLTTAY